VDKQPRPPGRVKPGLKNPAEGLFIDAGWRKKRLDYFRR
jgi:hypothetical protein